MASQVTSSGYVPRGSVQLFYEREGNDDSSTVLFIHELGGNFDLIRFDFSGHGRSSVPSDSSVESYVADCEAIINHLELKNIVVVGHSFGGLISIHLGAKRPNIVKGVVAIGPPLSPPEAGQKALMARAAMVQKQEMVAIADVVIANAFSAKSLASSKGEVYLAREMLTRQDPEGYALAVDALAQEDKVSTLITGIDIVRYIGSNAQQVACKDTGHWHMLESADECIKAITSVVRDTK
ncbi:alpha/beta-hydrolase [Jackrogersella minutella]|nr:alpha/beta-hydrolase [Jackrogersella minutella]